MDTIYALASARGKAGVAVLRLSGPLAHGAVARLKTLANAAVEAIPACPGRTLLRAAMLEEVGRLLPRKLAAA